MRRIRRIRITLIEIVVIVAIVLAIGGVSLGTIFRSTGISNFIGQFVQDNQIPGTGPTNHAK